MLVTLMHQAKDCHTYRSNVDLSNGKAKQENAKGYNRLVRVENAYSKVANVFTFLSLKANLEDGKVHLTITDNTKRKIFINRHELPRNITGDLSDPEEVDI